MLSVKGYYDGDSVRLLEKIPAKPNQRVIITIIDEFLEPEFKIGKKGIRGILSQYADSELAKKEEGAWESAAAQKNYNT